MMDGADGAKTAGGFPGERLDEAARAWAEGLRAPDASLDAAVMALVRAEPRGRTSRRALWRLMVEPRVVRVRPVWGLAAAAALVLVLLRPSVPTVPSVIASGPDTLYVHFALTAPSASDVTLAGTFNGWSAGELRLHRGPDGTWEATVPLPLGEHRYQFVVDGTWQPDPAAPMQVADDFGGTNSVIVVGPKGVVRS